MVALTRYHATSMIRSMSLRLTRVLCGAFVLSLLAVPSAVAAPGWLAPTNFVKETGGVGQPRIAVDGQVWQPNENSRRRCR